jgi:biopolymer transport protein ExbD
MPLVDVLLSLVAFLLLSFSADATCGAHQRVPSADNGSPELEGPIVVVLPAAVLIDGVPVAAGDDVAGQRVTPLSGLLTTLKAKRELWRQLSLGGELPDAITLEVDRSVSAGLVKSAAFTASQAGFASVGFRVRTR